MLVVFAFFVAVLFTAAAADHSVCGWTGPGPGNPAQYGFRQWCFALRVELQPYASARPSQVRYMCDRAEVANWGFLRNEPVLELNTACNKHGFAEDGGVCNGVYWAYCLTNNTNMLATNGLVCLYQTAYNDCEWPGTFTIDSLPARVAIYRACEGSDTGCQGGS